MSGTACLRSGRCAASRRPCTFVWLLQPSLLQQLALLGLPESELAERTASKREQGLLL